MNKVERKVIMKIKTYRLIKLPHAQKQNNRSNTYWKRIFTWLPFIITLYEFRALDEMKQWDAVWDGVHIDKRNAP